jgi:tRNA threonylcarbamoyladenosine biosynthesis protein TsaE
MKASFISQSHQDTIQYGRILAHALSPGSVVGLIGELGAGKTCLIKGIASTMAGISEDDITSPTFTILQEFESAIPIYHFDLYRIRSVEDLHDIGFDEYLHGEGVTVIEWADKVADVLRGPCLIISIDFINASKRRFTFRAQGNKYIEILRKVCTEMRKGVH